MAVNVTAARGKLTLGPVGGKGPVVLAQAIVATPPAHDGSDRPKTLHDQLPPMSGEVGTPWPRVVPSLRSGMSSSVHGDALLQFLSTHEFRLGS
jgi:hypothetical protein